MTMTAKQISSAKKKVYYFLLWPIVVLLGVWVLYLAMWASYMQKTAPIQPLGETYVFLLHYSASTFFVFLGLMGLAWLRSWDV